MGCSSLAVENNITTTLTKWLSRPFADVVLLFPFSGGGHNGSRPNFTTMFPLLSSRQEEKRRTDEERKKRKGGERGIKGGGGVLGFRWSLSRVGFLSSFRRSCSSFLFSFFLSYC